MTGVVLQVEQQFSPTGGSVCDKSERKLERVADDRGEFESSKKCFVPSHIVCEYPLNLSDNN